MAILIESVLSGHDWFATGEVIVQGIVSLLMNLVMCSTLTIPSGLMVAERHPSVVETLPAIALGDSSDGLPGSTRNCTLVELYPGYPGYRGNITGVMPHANGTGDYTCLQDLEDGEDGDPSFDRKREDRANHRAARSLGIDGSFEDWTWENWLLIEIERGMAPQCYTCLMLDNTTRPINQGIHPEPNDPRILIGFIQTTFAIENLLDDIIGGRNRKSNIYYDDYLLRSAAYVSLGSSANAHELLDRMYEILEETFKPGGGWYTLEQMYEIVTNYGGYIPTHRDMFPWDQIVISDYTLLAGMTAMMPDIANRVWIEYREVTEEWVNEGSPGRLADYLQRHWNL